MKKRADQLFTPHQIAIELDMSEETVRKWLRAEGAEPVRTRKRKGHSPVCYYDRSVLKLVESHKQKKPESPYIDPDTGLTWGQLETREKARKLARENEEAEAIKSGRWMEVTQHHQILKAVTDRLDDIPKKARSVAGCNDAQVGAIQRLLDEARKEAAAEIRKMK